MFPIAAQFCLFLIYVKLVQIYEIRIEISPK